jgi:hypothetical protein
LSPIAISSTAFVLIFGGVFLGAWLRNTLPGHHLNADAKDVVRLGASLMATIAALVLGLLINSAKSSYDTQRNQVRQMTANLILLDRLLNAYGPETQEARELLRKTVDPLIRQLWIRDQSNDPATTTHDPIPVGEMAAAKIFGLSPKTDAQNSLKSRATQVASDIAQLRLSLSELSGGTIPVPFLAILVFWLMIIFASFSLFSRLNSTVVVVLLVFALLASTALFLILEMDNPFTGVMQISDVPLRNALVPPAH